MIQALTIFEIILLIIVGVPVFYLVFLMLAGLFYRDKSASSSSQKNQLPGGEISPVRFAIVIPAHDETLTLPASLQAMKKLQTSYSPPPLIVVVADNCTDDTAELARQAGVVVYERTNLELRGKGPALQWAIERLNRDYEYDALIIFDADTLPDMEFLKEADKALQTGCQVLQGRYDVLNQTQTWRSTLLYTAFILFNHVRPLGRAALGLSDGLRGNGMVFRREILQQLPWEAFSLVEDMEYTNRLALAGLKVTYVPSAKLYGQAAETREQATSQRLRWESGRWQQARQDVPPLLGRAIKKFDMVALDRAIDLLIPPLALLAISLLGLTFVNLVLCLWLGFGSLGAILVGWLGLLVALALFVFGGLAVAKAPAHAYRALLFAPFYILWKVQIYLLMLFRRGPQQWVRTNRTKIELSDSHIYTKPVE